MMLITDAAWDKIRHQFTEDEKKALRTHIAGETICPRGICVDETALPAPLAEKLKAAVSSRSTAAKDVFK